MNEHFIVRPEVAGELGPSTLLDATQHPPVVHELHYVFQDWLGDTLLEGFPCFICTSQIAERIDRSDVTGVGFNSIKKISKSREFSEFNGRVRLPRFVWMKVYGVAGEDDFGLSPDFCLVVSAFALKILRSGKLDNAEVSLY